MECSVSVMAGAGKIEGVRGVLVLSAVVKEGNTEVSGRLVDGGLGGVLTTLGRVVDAV